MSEHKNPEEFQHLIKYGYAPGRYMNTCHRCKKTTDWVEKRAITCRPCAEELYEADSAKPTVPTFRRGDLVKKLHGSHWRGKVVGEYSTELTPEGYVVESDYHPGSAKIYPVGALRLIVRQSADGE